MHPQLNSAWWLTTASATPPCSKPDRLRTAASTACGENTLNARRSPATWGDLVREIGRN